MFFHVSDLSFVGSFSSIYKTSIGLSFDGAQHGLGALCRSWFRTSHWRMACSLAGLNLGGHLPLQYPASKSKGAFTNSSPGRSLNFTSMLCRQHRCFCRAHTAVLRLFDAERFTLRRTPSSATTKFRAGDEQPEHTNWRFKCRLGTPRTPHNARLTAAVTSTSTQVGSTGERSPRSLRTPPTSSNTETLLWSSVTSCTSIRKVAWSTSAPSGTRNGYRSRMGDPWDLRPLDTLPWPCFPPPATQRLNVSSNS